MSRNAAWAVESFVRTGEKHKVHNMLCQDQVAYQEKGEFQAIALIDGNGKTDLNAECGKKIAELLADFLIGFYQSIMESDDQVIAYNLLLQIHRQIDQMCETYQVEAREFASTLLGVVIDRPGNCYCLIHLGDGKIVARTEKNKILVLSDAKNGEKINETFLTTSVYAMSNIEVKKGSLHQLKEVALISDGMISKRRDYMLDALIKEEDLKMLPLSEDDISMIKLRKY